MFVITCVCRSINVHIRYLGKVKLKMVLIRTFTVYRLYIDFHLFFGCIGTFGLFIIDQGILGFDPLKIEFNH